MMRFGAMHQTPLETGLTQRYDAAPPRSRDPRTDSRRARTHGQTMHGSSAHMYRGPYGIVGIILVVILLIFLLRLLGLF